ncbi:MAG: hypothetical protein AAGB11_02135 [Pseudomonadota bacterium]
MGKPIVGALAERYLVRRELVGVRGTRVLRFHARCLDRRNDDCDLSEPEPWPALLAKVTDRRGTLAGLYRTLLDPQSADRAPLDPNRKAVGHLLGNRARIGKPTDLLDAGEGLEIMLSLRVALPGLPVVAALSPSHLTVLFLFFYLPASSASTALPMPTRQVAVPQNT